MNTSADTDGVDDDVVLPGLAPATWLVQDLEISMPPVPQIYMDTVEELVAGRIFCTDVTLSDLSTTSGLQFALASGEWPASGLAFGALRSGAGDVWFYCLVSGRMLILISIRLSNRSIEDLAAGRVAVNVAHARLEAYLSDPDKAHRAIEPTPAEGGGPRRVLVITNQEGYVQNLVAQWTPDGGLSAFETTGNVFADVPAAEFDTGAADLVFFRP